MTSKKLKQEFAKARQLCDNATSGTWSFEEDLSNGPKHHLHTVYAGADQGRHGLNLFGRMVVDWNGENNLNFICAARSTLPKALDHIEKQDQEIARLKKKIEKLSKKP